MPTSEMAEAALSCTAFADAIRLATWVGPSRELTARGVLRPAIAVQACQALGIPVGSGRLRSAMDVPGLRRAWAVAVAADLVLVAAGRTSTAPVAAEIAAAADGAGQLEPGLADRVLLAWLRAASEEFGFPDDVCAACMTMLIDLAKADDPVDVSEVIAAVLSGAEDDPEDQGTYICQDCCESHEWSVPDSANLDIVGLNISRALRDEELVEHALITIDVLRDFGAVSTGPGKSPEGTVALTALGRLFASSALAVAADDEVPGLAGQTFLSTFHALGGEVTPKLLADLESCGHPNTAQVAALFASGGGTAAVSRSPAVVPTRRVSGPADNGKLCQFLITLRYVDDPPVWRRVVVPAGITLGQLHSVIQDVFGWDRSHLHMFTAGKATYGVPDGDFMSDEQNENAVRLSDLLSRKGQKLSYTYDFGDDWDHLVKLERFLLPGSDDALAAGPVPVCLAGEGACPPEDCGGAGGYWNLKEALANPDHDDHEDMLEWLGLDDSADFNPAEFDLAEVNQRLRGQRRTSGFMNGLDGG